MPRNLLLLRFIIFNACGAALLVWAWRLGYAQQVFEGDVSHISYVITALFAVGLISTTFRVLAVNSAVNATPTHGKLWSPGYMKAQAAAGKLHIRNAHIADAIEWLTLLGLIGNVVGFLVAMHGADVSSLNSAEGTQAFAGQMLKGLGVAFYTTLLGVTFALWTSINYRMLDTATALHVEGLK